jgi:hypothetical protein
MKIMYKFGSIVCIERLIYASSYLETASRLLMTGTVLAGIVLEPFLNKKSGKSDPSEA